MAIKAGQYRGLHPPNAATLLMARLTGPIPPSSTHPPPLAPPSGVAGLAALALAEAALKSAAEPCAVPVAGQTAVWDSL